MASTHKKVIVRKMDRDSVNGYVGAHFLVDGKLDLLNSASQAMQMDLREIKGVYFVREWGDVDLARKTFTTRPRTEGLWVRLTFRDNETLEGTMPNNLASTFPEGFLINPPDSRSNTQRIFVPRTALTELAILGVVGAPQKRRTPGVPERQVPLFGE